MAHDTQLHFSHYSSVCILIFQHLANFKGDSAPRVPLGVLGALRLGSLGDWANPDFRATWMLSVCVGGLSRPQPPPPRAGPAVPPPTTPPPPLPRCRPGPIQNGPRFSACRSACRTLRAAPPPRVRSSTSQHMPCTQPPGRCYSLPARTKNSGAVRCRCWASDLPNALPK